MDRFNRGNINSSLFNERFERGRLEEVALEVPDTSCIPVNIYLARFDPLTEDPLDGVISPVKVAHSYASIEFRTPFFNGYIEVPNSENIPAKNIFYRALETLFSVVQKEELDLEEMELSLLLLYKDKKMKPELEQAYQNLAGHFKDVTVFDGTIKQFEEEIKSYRS
ncbi:hypothetical protein GF371_02395 [Candidatus Woesearchaeota archaeon]|nr:hypothetical protein [Candidatus Woesearchaeota archaeon]